MDAPEDLKFYNETIKKQTKELKNQLRNNDRAMQVLCLSKLLYLEMSELNNLVQVCFALVLKERSEGAALRKKNNDLRGSEKVLRDLVEGIANDRENVEKRIFYLENQNMKSSALIESMETEIK
jgi:hypothetical protein